MPSRTRTGRDALHANRWRGVHTIPRSLGSAVVEARKRFRRVHGHRDLPKLARALAERERTPDVETENEAA